MNRRRFQGAWAIAETKWLNTHYCDSALTLRKRQCSHEGRIFLDLIGSGRQWSPQNRGPRPLEELPCPARRQPAAALTERSPSPVLHPLGLVDRNAAVLLPPSVIRLLCHANSSCRPVPLSGPWPSPPRPPVALGESAPPRNAPFIRKKLSFSLSQPYAE
jgi:hypothetical protein